MPLYRVRYKTDADEDRRSWPLGPHPDRDYALATFNSAYARPGGLGTFAFDQADSSPADYHLIEREDGHEVDFALRQHWPAAA